jgi:hypothetical protein
MLGYGYVAMGTDDTVSSPTCGTDKTEITSAKSCSTTTNWSTTDGLCVTGVVPEPDKAYKSWGVSVGVNATDPDGGTLGQAFSSMTFTITGSPTSGLRAQVHVKGDSASTNYCVDGISSGTAVSFSKFNTKCYDSPADGDDLAAADVKNIDKVMVQINPDTTAEVKVTDLCITEIDFKL